MRRSRSESDRRPAAPSGQSPGPADPTIAWLLSRARSLEDGGEATAALPFLQRAAQLSQPAAEQADIQARLALIHRDQDDPGRAVSHLRQAVELSPERADLLFLLGLAHAQQENVRAAVDALSRACQLDPRHAEAQRCLGVALAGLGDDAAADSALAAAEALAPDDVRVLESVATQHLKLGRFSDCSRVLAKASQLAPDNRVVRKLAKETSYLVERLASGAMEGAPTEARRLRVALEGAAGEVESVVARSMTATGFRERQVENARSLWRDFVAVRGPRVRGVQEHAAAVEFTIARLDFADHSSRADVAARHATDEASMARIYREIVAALDIAVFDPRYSTQPHPVVQVGEEATRNGLEPEEVFQALIEDEFREYLENHDRSGALEARFEREAFEEASVEYGALLTREMMGLALSRRDRVRKRELERLLLVT